MSVTTQAIESIRAMIADGTLAPGDRLPPEQELAEQLGLSRGSLREAVRALAQIKVLDVRRGDGTYVRSLQPGDLLSGMGFALELVQARGLDEVLEVRRLLFPPAAGLAAQRVTVAQLNAMRSIIDELEVTEDSEKIAELHRQFQGIVADATGNAWLSSILHTLQIEGEHVRRAWLNSDPAMREVAIAHQKLILDALERRDSEMARSIAMIQVDARRRWLEHLRATPVDVDADQVPAASS